MPTKKGAGGHQQNYDSHGRYIKSAGAPLTRKLTKKEKARKKQEHRREELLNRAKNKNDPIVYDTVISIDDTIPGEITSVNMTMFDDIHGKEREFDIITKKCIIEIKSGKARHGLTQFSEQKEFAKKIGKTYMVFAPNMAFGSEKKYQKEGITIIRSLYELVKKLKESKK